GDRLHVPASESVHTGPARFPCLDRRRGQVLRSRRGPRISAVDVRDIAAAAAASFHPALIPREHSRLHPRPTPASAKYRAGGTPGRAGGGQQANPVTPIQATRASPPRRHASEERTLAQASEIGSGLLSGELLRAARTAGARRSPLRSPESPERLS